MLGAKVGRCAPATCPYDPRPSLIDRFGVVRHVFWRGIVGRSLAGLADGFSVAQQNVGFPKLVNDLFGVVPFLRHGSDLLSWLFATFDLDQIFQTGHGKQGLLKRMPRHR